MTGDLHYRIYRTREAYKVVCVQWFDLDDYETSRWVKNAHGDPMEFESEDEAADHLQRMTNKPRRVRVERFVTDLGTCQWFLLCENEAAGVVAHPILGVVPACQRCADTAEETLLAVVEVEPGVLEARPRERS